MLLAEFLVIIFKQYSSEVWEIAKWYEMYATPAICYRIQAYVMKVLRSIAGVTKKNTLINETIREQTE